MAKKEDTDNSFDYVTMHEYENDDIIHQKVENIRNYLYS